MNLFLQRDCIGLAHDVLTTASMGHLDLV